ncbi:MAG: DoxX family membrane protein [Patescibacteria group bacterium]
MVQSLRYSQWVLRLSLAAVFLWFGVGKFINPDYWINAWLPQWIYGMLETFNISAKNFMYLNGIFEVLVGVSVVSGIFIRIFSVLAGLFLLGVMGTHGLNEVLVRDVALVGGFLALFFWPDRHLA